MPSPSSGQLEGFAQSALDAAGLRGRDAPGLARALAKTSAQALAMFVQQAQVAAAIPASAPPPSNSGSTIGPGILVVPPGSLHETALSGLAHADLAEQGIAGANARDLAQVIGAGLAQAIALFTRQAQVDKGIPIAGLLTTAPGPLVWQREIDQPQLQPLIDALRLNHRLLGAGVPGLVDAMAAILAHALALLRAQAMMAPQVACSPSATVAPGKLI